MCLCLRVAETLLPEGVPVAVSEEFQAAQKMLPAPHCVHLRLVSMLVRAPAKNCVSFAMTHHVPMSPSMMPYMAVWKSFHDIST